MNLKGAFFISAIMMFASFASCKNQVVEDSVTISGKIENKKTDSIVLYGINTIDSTSSRTIKLDDDGSFFESFKTSPVQYAFWHGDTLENFLFLANGYNLDISMDATKQKETLRFSGVGSNANLYLMKESRENAQTLYGLGLETLSDEAYIKKVKENSAILKKNLQNASVQDSVFNAFKLANIEQIENALIDKRKNNPSKLVGKVSPKFEDYYNYAGGTSSLNDFKGKYVYIDMWATWCKPCKVEIPFLEKVEKKYHGKNIVFVSISIDKQKDKAKWETMIKEKSMGGIQLLADKDVNSQFYKDYHISGIPRFILLDPYGNIVSADAPRPSDSEGIAALFEQISDNIN